MAEFATFARLCRDCLKLRRVRDSRTRKIQPLFRTVTVDASRISICPFMNEWSFVDLSWSPLTELLPDRCTPELRRLQAELLDPQQCLDLTIIDRWVSRLRHLIWHDCSDEALDDLFYIQQAVPVVVRINGIARYPQYQVTDVCLGFFGRQGLRGHANLPSDRLSDKPEWHAFLSDSMKCFVPGTSFKSEVEDTCIVQPTL